MQGVVRRGDRVLYSFMGHAVRFIMLWGQGRRERRRDGISITIKCYEFIDED